MIASRENISLPEAMIQNIQSFLDGKEAARTTILSKSWYDAWLTRPTIHLCEADFRRDGGFHEHASTTMRRYHLSNLKIESFTLKIYKDDDGDDDELLTRTLTSDAIKLGASDITLSCRALVFPLAFQTLTRLSLERCKIKLTYGVSCSNLNSLSLKCVHLGDYVFREIMLSCRDSIEELSMSLISCGFVLSRWNLYKLHKLKRLSLNCVEVDNMFFTDFGPRFPCLNHLTLNFCRPFTKGTWIASTSLQYINFEGTTQPMVAFDVPNIRTFTFAYTEDDCMPSDFFCIQTAPRREWDFDISIRCYRPKHSLWFSKLKTFLTKFRQSRMSLSFTQVFSSNRFAVDSDVKVVPVDPLVLENLKIDAPHESCCGLLARLLGICCPKFITHYVANPRNKETIDMLGKKLMHENMLAQFDVQVVKMEYYEQFLTGWRRLLLKDDASITPVRKHMARYKLRWGGEVAPNGT